MSKHEIDIMWQQAMKQSIEDGEMFTRYHFAKLVAERALADSMREVQRLGQEIEQKIGCVNHDCDQCKAQPEQEPVGSVVRWMDSSLIHGWFGDPPPEGTLLYTHLPQRTEQNFCSRCGKRTKDIHTCTPPRENT